MRTMRMKLKEYHPYQLVNILTPGIVDADYLSLLLQLDPLAKKDDYIKEKANFTKWLNEQLMKVDDFILKRNKMCMNDSCSYKINYINFEIKRLNLSKRKNIHDNKTIQLNLILIMLSTKSMICFPYKINHQ